MRGRLAMLRLAERPRSAAVRERTIFLAGQRHGIKRQFTSPRKRGRGQLGEAERVSRVVRTSPGPLTPPSPRRREAGGERGRASPVAARNSSSAQGGRI